MTASRLALATALLLASCGPPPGGRAAEATLPTTVTALGPLRVGAPAPPFGGLRIGKRVVLGLDDLRDPAKGLPEGGPRVVVVSFFATWCYPCRTGLTTLQRLSDELSDQGLRVVLVAVGQRGAGPARFLRELGVTLPALSDRFYSIAERYGVASPARAGGEGGESAILPKTVVVDHEGVVRVIYADEAGDFEGHLRGSLRSAGVRPPRSL